MARRKGTRWYVAGISGRDTPGALAVDLRFLKGSRFTATVLFDGADPAGFSARTETVKAARQAIPVARHGGFVMVLDPLR